jgi:hypothetical protein
MDIERRYATGSGLSTPPGPAELPGGRARLEDRRQGAAAAALGRTRASPGRRGRPGGLFGVKPAGRRGGEHVCGVDLGERSGNVRACPCVPGTVVTRFLTQPVPWLGQSEGSLSSGPGGRSARRACPAMRLERVLWIMGPGRSGCAWRPWPGNPCRAVKNGRSNRIAEVWRYRALVLSLQCGIGCGRPASQLRDRSAGPLHGWRGLDAAGPGWISWDMIHNVRRADQAHSEVTDARRTGRGFHAAKNGESAGQRLFRWAGMGGL